MIIIFNQELVKEVVGLRRSVEEQGKKLADLENYIDTLVKDITHKKYSMISDDCVLQPDLMNKKKFQFNPNAFQTLKVLLQW